MTLTKLHSFLDRLLFFKDGLDVAKLDPHMVNGLMVRGREEVRKVGFGVSASLALFDKAKKVDCDVLIVHHSFNLPPYNCYDSIFQNRIAFLIKNGISLFGYHFLLDAHPEVGNNVQILKTIKAEPIEPYLHHGGPWGWLGKYKKGATLANIKASIAPYLSKRAVVYPFGQRVIKNVVAVSGKGAPFASDMSLLIEKQIDLFITGEVHEWNRELFREAGINFIAGGHYATETFGIKKLMEKVKKEFPKLEVEFLDVYNEI